MLIDMPEKVSATTFIPFNGKEQLATYDPSRGGFIVHDEVDAFVAKKLHTCDTDLKSQFYVGVRENLSVRRHVAGNRSTHR